MSGYTTMEGNVFFPDVADEGGEKMGYALATSECFGCKRLFSYNPVRVPSIRIGADGHPSPTGDRKPVCKSCITRANIARRKNGLDPLVAHPDAYEACEEGELS